ncbi:MAG: asparaginase [Bauldia sp.]|nr:asparaginase [Bauldia sp.]
MTASTRPTVRIVALGGTIAAVPRAPGQAATMDLDADDLVRALPGLSGIADISAETFRQTGSADLGFADIVALAAHIDGLARGGIGGVVVTQGTDTMEETAYLLDRLVDADLPVVVTGAMRGTGVPGADGPANLIAGVRVAASAQARDMGVLVVMNDAIHLARSVRKGHATSPSTFESPLLGPVGWVAEDRVRIPLIPRRRLRRFTIANPASPPQVALLTLSLGDTPRLIEAVGSRDFDGAVIAAYGAGHTSQRVLDGLAALADRMPTVFASRTGVGETHTRSCDFPGSELRLLERGLIPAYALDPLKARLLLTLLLAEGASRDAIRAEFAAEND